MSYYKKNSTTLLAIVFMNFNNGFRVNSMIFCLPTPVLLVNDYSIIITFFNIFFKQSLG